MTDICILLLFPAFWAFRWLLAPGWAQLWPALGILGNESTLACWAQTRYGADSTSSGTEDASRPFRRPRAKLTTGFFLNWSLVELQCCVNYCCIAKWLSYICVCVCVCVCVCILLLVFSIMIYIGYWIQFPVRYSRTMNEITPLAATRIQLEMIILSEVRKTNAICHHLYVEWKYDRNEPTQETEIEPGNRLAVVKGRGDGRGLNWEFWIPGANW